MCGLRKWEIGLLLRSFSLRRDDYAPQTIVAIVSNSQSLATAQIVRADS